MSNNSVNQPDKINRFEPPKWASPGPKGSFLSVIKDDECVETFPLDEQNYYIFGRTYGDILILHESCSGVHAALTYHKELSRWYIFDISSTHGTFVGGYRIPAEQLTPIDLDLPVKFAASTRLNYIRLEGQDPKPEIIEKPKIVENTKVFQPDQEKQAFKLVKKRKFNKSRKVSVISSQKAEPEYFDHSLIPGDFTGRFEYTANTYVLESPDSHNNRQVMMKVMNQKKKQKERFDKKYPKKLSTETKSHECSHHQPNNSDPKITFFKNLRF